MTQERKQLVDLLMAQEQLQRMYRRINFGRGNTRLSQRIAETRSKLEATR